VSQAFKVKKKKISKTEGKRFQVDAHVVKI